MTIKRKVAFLHILNTGGSSVLPICLYHNVQIIGHDIRDENYLSLAQYKALHPDSYAFAFVRNPWDRVVSSFIYLQGGGNNDAGKKDCKLDLPYDSFMEFVLNAFKTDKIFQQLHFKPQFTWLTSDHTLLIDSFGKFESLQADFSKYCDLLQIPNYKLPHLNSTRHEHYMNYYDADTWKIVHDAYKADIDLFGYETDFYQK